MKGTLRVLIVAALLGITVTAGAAEGLIAVPSPYNPQTTMKRFKAVVKKNGMHIFALIDHAAGAAKVGLKLRPTAVLIFGNPVGGTALMQCGQTAGIDMPLKALVWQDAAGKVWLGYNDPAYIARRHGIGECHGVVKKLSKALAGFAAAATKS